MSTPRVSIERIALVILPITLAAIFIAVLAMETVEIRYDLQLSSPEQVAPGAIIPLRARFFVPGDALAPPDPLAAPVAFTLRDEGGEVVSSGELAPAPAGLPPRAAADAGTPVGDPANGDRDGRAGMEGEFRAPEITGRYTLEASVLEDGAIVAHCSAPLVVTAQPRRSAPRGRPMMAMQTWEPRRMVVAPGQEGPRALELRVRGGYCVPGVDCELLVWVGEPAAAVHIEAAGFEVDEVLPAEETAGIVRVRARITGPEAVATVIASRAGIEVARREVQLPIVLSGVELGATPTSCPAPCAPAYESPPDLPLFVDAYRAGVWSRAASVAPRDSGPGTLPLELGAGLWRVQVRSDPFGSESAATRFVFVGPGEDAIPAIRRRLEDEGSRDEFTAALPIAGIAPEDQLAFAAALLEMDVIALPRGRSGSLQRDLGWGQGRTTSRWISSLAVFAVGLFVTAFVVRRGLSASAEARSVMAAAGTPGARSRRRVLSMTLTVLAVALATILAFVAAALLLLTRGV